ncbi:MAG TPA: VWA domain-containing protein [Acetobacteraceae bacterium]|nr:VWA domain-containing protein [Acetobacteraceae bacterium]
MHLSRPAGEVGEHGSPGEARAARPSPASLRASTALVPMGDYSASEPLRRFLQVARGAGLRVSASEGIDAARAVDVVGFGDRAVLKDTLGLVLAKTPDEKGLFDECFELYFKRDEFAAADAVEPPALPEPMSARDPTVGGDGAGGEGGGATLGQMLLDDDRAALAAAMEQAAHEAGLENIRFFTQKNLYARRILDRMGLRALEREIEALRQSGADEAIVRAGRLEARIEALRDALRDFVERHLVLFARGETERFREELLKSARLSNLERRDLDRMRVLVRAMAKKLAARYAKTRRRRLRGQLDVRRTMRRNMGWGGIPFITVWKQKRIEKPRVMVLCDVSGSVAPMAQFLLMFLYAVHEALSDIRSFAFAGSLVEVSDILDKQEIEAAIDEIMRTIGYGSSNYGNSLADFEDGWGAQVTNKTTIIILGDARGNRTDPRTEIMARLAQRAKRIIWLNPEYRSAWGTGDSDMYRYAAFCNLVTVCNTLRHLERAITDLLEGAT